MTCKEQAGKGFKYCEPSFDYAHKHTDAQRAATRWVIIRLFLGDWIKGALQFKKNIYV